MGRQWMLNRTLCGAPAEHSACPSSLQPALPPVVTLLPPEILKTSIMTTRNEIPRVFRFQEKSAEAAERQSQERTCRFLTIVWCIRGRGRRRRAAAFAAVLVIGIAMLMALLLQSTERTRNRPWASVPSGAVFHWGPRAWTSAPPPEPTPSPRSALTGTSWSLEPGPISCPALGHPRQRWVLLRQRARPPQAQAPCARVQSTVSLRRARRLRRPPWVPSEANRRKPRALRWRRAWQGRAVHADGSGGTAGNRASWSDSSAYLLAAVLAPRLVLLCAAGAVVVGVGFRRLRRLLPPSAAESIVASQWRLGQDPLAMSRWHRVLQCAMTRTAQDNGNPIVVHAPQVTSIPNMHSIRHTLTDRTCPVQSYGRRSRRSRPLASGWRPASVRPHTWRRGAAPHRCAVAKAA